MLIWTILWRDLRILNMHKAAYENLRWEALFHKEWFIILSVEFIIRNSVWTLRRFHIIIF